MFEEKKSKTSRSYSFRLFPHYPWVFSAYILLLVIMLVSLLVFGSIDALYHVDFFGKVADKMLSHLEFVIGAIVGALSVVVKNKYSGD